VRRFVTAAAVAALCAAGTLLVATPAQAAGAPCVGTIQITSLTLNPTPATPGQTVTATVVAQNCTSQPQQASVMYVARYVSASGGFPAGCPVIDPLPPQQVSFAAGGAYTGALGYHTLSGCTATALQVTARFTDSAGVVLATRTSEAPLVQTPPCAVTYRATSQWPGGFVAQVSILNTGATAIAGWSLAFAFPGDQRVTSGWDAAVRQSGPAVTADDVRYNASIAPGATATFGFLGSWKLGNASPTVFALNGAICQTR
jgi:hypothetical protein